MKHQMAVEFAGSYANNLDLTLSPSLWNLLQAGCTFQLSTNIIKALKEIGCSVHQLQASGKWTMLNKLLIFIIIHSIRQDA